MTIEALRGGADITIGLCKRFGFISGRQDAFERVKGLIIAARGIIGSNLKAGSMTIDVAVGVKPGRCSGELANAWIILAERRPAMNRADRGIDDRLDFLGDFDISLGIDHS